MDEWELLQRFAQHGSQEAFAELVGRHLNFVYSSARRQVRSPQLAEEVAQNVFLELAQQAARLEPGTPLTAWLYVVTRRAALNALRGELRRQAREQAAFELSAMNSVPSVWEKLAPLLDEALETLDAPDRSALLLRYFDHKPLREVGAALNTSEDAAQKRVSRALEQLRRSFARAGVAISAAGLATELSAHAIEVAPAGLGGLISIATASAAASTPVTAVQAVQAAAMTTFQKILLVGAVVVIGVSVYEVRAVAASRDRLAGLEQEAAALAAREFALRQERDAARSRLSVVQAEAARTAAAAPAAVPRDPAIVELLSRAGRLKGGFEADPRLKIPEMALLQDTDWLDAARERALDSEANLRASLARIRTTAKGRLTRSRTQAFSAYVRANDGRLPVTAQDLQSHITPPMDPTVLRLMLARYETPAQGSIVNVPDKGVLIQESAQAMIDPDYDDQFMITRMARVPDKDPFKINTGSNSVRGWLAPPSVMFLR